MQSVELGPIRVSPIVAGVWRMSDWNLSVGERVAYIEGALDRGVTTFDHADIYGNYAGEGLFGEALRSVPALRERIQLVSKCNIKLVSDARPAHRVKHYDSSAEHIVASVEASLRNLATDRLDLLLLHRPDVLLDADEVAEAFEGLRRAGKVRAFGVSNFLPHQFELLASRTALVTNQVEFSPLALDVLFDGTLDQAQRLRTRPMIWSPLAGGRLFTSDEPRAVRVRLELARLAALHEVSAETIAHAFVLRHPSRPLSIAGSRRLAALDHAVRALSLNLSRQDFYALLVASTGEDVP